MKDRYSSDVNGALRCGCYEHLANECELSESVCFSCLRPKKMKSHWILPIAGGDLIGKIRYVSELEASEQ